MADIPFNLARPPIVEAVLDIDCEYAAGFSVEGAKEQAKSLLTDYPKFRTVTRQSFELRLGEEAQQSIKSTVEGLQFRSQDERQIVQVRAGGYSFNRLAPYEGFDNYLAEIQRTWLLFKEITKPVQVSAVRMQYINRLELPAVNGGLDLRRYLQVSPTLPEGANLVFASFINQHTAFELGTGIEASITLASEKGTPHCYPVVFDIRVTLAEGSDPDDWERIQAKINSLRSLKNRIFRHTLSETCLNLYQL